MAAERVHWRVVVPAAALQAVALTLGSFGYGYHRDELYFRMLPPAWGYVDQPPLTPLLARLTTHLADEPWALRLPATLATALSVVVVALVCRELGGGRGAQALAAWGYAFAAMPLMLGHILLTSTVDLLLLALLVLAVLRADLGLAPVVARGRSGSRARHLQPPAGRRRGASASCSGSRCWGRARAFARRPPGAGPSIAVVVSLPNLLYQATHGWPQLAMGAALSDNNAAEVRSQLPLLLLVMLGPPLVAVWGTGLVWLLRRERRSTVGYLAVGAVVVIVFTFASGAQPHYPIHLLAVLYAAGCVPVARWLAARRALRGWPSDCSPSTPPCPSRSPSPWSPSRPSATPRCRTSAPWSRTRSAGRLRGPGRRGVPRLRAASHRGDRLQLRRGGGHRPVRPRAGTARPVSGHNSLATVRRPADASTVVVVVGYQLDEVAGQFASCEVVDRLDNGLDVDNEEQGAPVAVCRDPREPWASLWPRFHHLD